MHLDIEGVPVLFPFDYVYPEQLKYMRELKYAIENKGNSNKVITRLSVIFFLESLR